MLETNIGVISHNDLLVIVDLELSVDHGCLQLLDSVLVEDAALDVLKGPGDQVVTSRSHDRPFLSLLSEVVEPGRLEIDLVNLVLRKVLRLNLQLLWVGLFFAHLVLETSFAVFTRSRNNQQVLIGGCENPSAIP